MSLGSETPYPVITGTPMDNDYISPPACAGYGPCTPSVSVSSTSPMQTLPVTGPDIDVAMWLALGVSLLVLGVIAVISHSKRSPHP